MLFFVAVVVVGGGGCGSGGGLLVILFVCLFCVLFLFFVCWLVPKCLLPVAEGSVLLDKDVSRRLIRLIVLIV